MFVLAALGPVFNIPLRWHTKTTEAYPKSLLFSQLITAKSQAEWMCHWTSTTAATLKAELARNYANEVYFLSEKISYKVGSLRWGKVFYKASLGFLGMLMIPVFTTDERIVYSVSAWLISGVVLQEILERATSPPAWNWRRLERLNRFNWSVFGKRNLRSLNFYFGFALSGWSGYLLFKGFGLYF